MNSSRPSVTVFQQDAIEQALPLDGPVIAAIENALAASSMVEVCTPAMMQILARDYGGQTCIKGAWIPGVEYFAAKLSSIYPRRPGAESTESNGMFILMESATGRVRACLLDNGYLTQLRTAAAGAVAARHLAPALVETLGVIGAGKQALWQIRAACLVRSPKQVILWSRRPEQAVALAKHMESLLRIPVHVADELQEAVAPAQLVITTTASRHALLTEEDVHPNLHITAVGSDAQGKRELSEGLLGNIDLYVADDLGQCRIYGELQGVSEGTVSRIALLGDIVAGKAQGRKEESQITVADLTGVGVEDTAVAIEAYRRL